MEEEARAVASYESSCDRLLLRTKKQKEAIARSKKKLEWPHQEVGEGFKAPASASNKEQEAVASDRK